MSSSLSDVYVTFAKLTKLDKHFQTKKYRAAFLQLVEYFNQILFSANTPLLSAKDDHIFFQNEDIMKVNLNSISVQSCEYFQLSVDKLARLLVRNIVNKNICDCEISDCELVDVHRDLLDIYDKTNVKRTDKVKKSGGNWKPKMILLL